MPELPWLKDWMLPWIGVVAAAAGGWVAYRVAFFLLRRASRNTDTSLDDLVVKHLRGPLRVLTPLVALWLVVPQLQQLEDPWRGPLIIAVGVLTVAAGTWLALRGLKVGEAFWLSRYDLDAPDNLTARAMHTRVRVGRNVASFVLLTLGLGGMLLTVPQGRELGASLLASAGVAGVVIGFAAQRSIATLIAGVQIAITQPIRLDDVVIVEGEWGRIEEITLTYVIVRVWDQRRLVVPITWFLDQPFQNWTRTTAELLGAVVLHVDPGVDVAALRTELQRIVEDSDLWDERVVNVQVVDTQPHTVTVRALVSAADAGAAWDLRCHVREQLLAYLEREQPEAMSRLRVLQLDTAETS